MLKLFLFATLSANATTLSGLCPTPGFTILHMTVSNCSTSIVYDISGDGVFTPLDLVGGTAGNIIDIHEPGGVALGSGPVAQSYVGTVTADFVMDPGWLLTDGGIRFLSGDDGPAAGEDVDLTAPCSAINSGNGGACRPFPPVSSGMIHLQLFARSDAVCPLCEHDSAHIDHGDLLFTEVQVPEPGTVGLISLGIALVFRRIK